MIYVLVLCVMITEIPNSVNDEISSNILVSVVGEIKSPIVILEDYQAAG